VLLAMLADVGADALEAVAFGAAGERGLGVDRAPGEVGGAALADGAVAFEGETEAVEARVAGGAARVLPVPREHVAEGQIHLRFVAGELGGDGGRRRDLLVEGP